VPNQGRSGRFAVAPNRERGENGSSRPAFALETKVILQIDTEDVPAGEIGTVVGYYAAGDRVDYAVGFESPPTLLRLPGEAIAPLPNR
jgi:hypothetical protein